MKSKFNLLAVLLFSVLFIRPAFSWGEKGHKLISKEAVNFLPAEMHAFIKWGDYLSEHAADADFRKKEDKTEGPKHYIDIDFYKEFLEGHMIQNKEKLVAKYGMDKVIKEGVLPWATLDTFLKLTQAFKDKDKTEALRLAADLGHYVADGHQPMHTVMNYNGQFTGQKGVHARYEIHMVDEHLKDLQEAFRPRPAGFVKEPLDYIFNYISDANSVCKVLFKADDLATVITGSKNSEDYYRLLWFRTNYITKIQFNRAAEDFAALMYTAWVNGGKPSFAEMK